MECHEETQYAAPCYVLMNGLGCPNPKEDPG